MKLITACVIAAFAATAATTAGATEFANKGYLAGGSGKIVMSGTGLCWHTSAWTPALAMEPCDPVAKPMAAYVTPAYIPGPAPVQAPTPSPAAAVPPPAPVAAVVVPLPRKISFSGDALFGFDESSLRPEGKVMLDALVRQLQGAEFDTILVTGHTDRIGRSEYNQKLSERRATTVKDYLVSKQVRAFRIDAEGKGETNPVTLAGECRGAKSAKIIACLQPDRRVDIEMTGTKTALK
jgi:OmpA-OmpF porin, OOP family